MKSIISEFMGVCESDFFLFLSPVHRCERLWYVFMEEAELTTDLQADSW